MSMRVTTNAFVEGGPIPERFARDGANLSPGLRWDRTPDEARSFVIMAQDPDAPGGTFTHWLLYDVPADVHSIDAGQSAGKPGRNGFQFNGYGGPQPPPRHGKHRYYFMVFALDTDSLGLDPGANAEQVEQAMQDHVIDKAEVMGLFERR